MGPWLHDASERNGGQTWWCSLSVSSPNPTCGLRPEFLGSHDPRLGRQREPPSNLRNPVQDGTMTLLDTDHARFDYAGGAYPFVASPGQRSSMVCAVSRRAAPDAGCLSVRAIRRRKMIWTVWSLVGYDDQCRFTRPPKAIRRPGIQLDNFSLISASLLGSMSAYRTLTDHLPKGTAAAPSLPHAARLSDRRQDMTITEEERQHRLRREGVSGPTSATLVPFRPTLRRFTDRCLLTRRSISPTNWVRS